MFLCSLSLLLIETTIVELYLELVQTFFRPLQRITTSMLRSVRFLAKDRPLQPAFRSCPISRPRSLLPLLLRYLSSTFRIFCWITLFFPISLCNKRDRLLHSCTRSSNNSNSNNSSSRRWTVSKIKVSWRTRTKVNSVRMAKGVPPGKFSWPQKAGSGSGFDVPSSSSSDPSCGSMGELNILSDLWHDVETWLRRTIELSVCLFVL